MPLQIRSTESTRRNPLIAFSTVATESGRFEFRWSGDNGYSVTQSATLTVF